MQGINNMKDTMSVTYLDVTYKGEPGRISLQSDSMAFFPAASDDMVVIPWNSVGKLHTGAMKSTATVSKEEYLLKVIMAHGPDDAFVFGMKSEPDLDKIRDDIQRLVKEYNNAHGGTTLAPVAGLFGSSSPGGSVHSGSGSSHKGGESGDPLRSSSALVVPPAGMDQDKESSLASVISRSVGAGSTRKAKTASVTGMEQPFQDEESLMPISNHSRPNEVIMVTDGDASDNSSVRSGSTAKTAFSTSTTGSNNNRTANASSRSRQGDANNENGTMNSSSGRNSTTRSVMFSSPFQKNRSSFQKDCADLPPVASYRLIPDQQHNERPLVANCNDTYLYPTKGVVPREKKMWQSTWFWLAMILLALLLLGIGIGIGMLGSNGLRSRSSNNSQQQEANEIVGLQDNTTETAVPLASALASEAPSEAPTSMPSLRSTGTLTSDAIFSETIPVLPAATPKPTTMVPATLPPSSIKPTEPACSVAHGIAVNDRYTAADAGTYGGSTFCRASILSLCQATEWVQFSKFTGSSSAWFCGTAYDDSFCAADVEHKVKLEVPEGIDYDLHIYEMNSPIPHDSSTNQGTRGGEREVVISSKDYFGDLMGPALHYLIHVEYKSGSSCEPWTLSVQGHECIPV